MIRLLSVLMLLVIANASLLAQEEESEYPVPYDKEKNKIIYQGVVEVANTDRATLYDRFQDWGSQHYRNYSGKVETRKPDAEVPMTELKTYVNLDTDKARERARFRLKVKFKDDRYRYTFYKFHKRKGYFYGLERWIEPETLSKEKAQKKLKALDKAVTDVVQSMKDYINQPPEEQDSSW
jgi:hypothetical protein